MTAALMAEYRTAIDLSADDELADLCMVPHARETDSHGFTFCCDLTPDDPAHDPMAYASRLELRQAYAATAPLGL